MRLKLACFALRLGLLRPSWPALLGGSDSIRVIWLGVAGRSARHSLLSLRQFAFWRATPRTGTVPDWPAILSVFTRERNPEPAFGP